MNEADTCRKYVLPKLVHAGWDNEPHSFTEQKTFTDERIVPAGSSRRPQKRADDLLDICGKAAGVIKATLNGATFSGAELLSVMLGGHE